MANELHNIRAVMDALLDARPRQRGDRLYAVVELGGLEMIDNSQRVSTHFWAAVSITQLIVGARTYRFANHMDVHISIGEWQLATATPQKT